MARKSQLRAEDLPYRPCVGVMVLNKDGLVWAGRRIADTNAGDDTSQHLWQMPQGGIDEGEDPLAAAYRELYEETGIQTVSLLGQSRCWIKYDLPPQLIGISLKGRYRGQSQRWFAFRFEGNEAEIRINPPPVAHDPEFDAWEWKQLTDLPDLIVPFKRSVYDQVIAEFLHLTA